MSSNYPPSVELDICDLPFMPGDRVLAYDYRQFKGDITTPARTLMLPATIVCRYGMVNQPSQGYSRGLNQGYQMKTEQELRELYEAAKAALAKHIEKQIEDHCDCVNCLTDLVSFACITDTLGWVLEEQPRSDSLCSSLEDINFELDVAQPLVFSHRIGEFNLKGT